MRCITKQGREPTGCMAYDLTQCVGNAMTVRVKKILWNAAPGVEFS